MRQNALTIRLVLALSCLMLTPLTAPAARAGAGEFAARRAARPTAVSGSVLPLHFEPNLGQADPEVKFVARAAGYTAFLTATGPVLMTPPRKSAHPVSEVRRLDTRDRLGVAAFKQQAPHAALRMRLIGAATDVPLVGEQVLAGRTNYLRGADESRWITDVPTYASVRWPGVYDGVDVRFHAAGGLLEYDFEVAPGADPRQILVWFEGQESASVDENGDLVLRVEGGELRQQRAIAYQEGTRGRISVGARYYIGSGGEVGLALDSYDTDVPLVIDPIFVYDDYIGGGTVDNGNAENVGQSIAVDGAGAAYVTGVTSFVNFPTPNGWDSNQNGGSDAFVTKLSPDGASLVYSTFIGGLADDRGKSIAVDGSGNAYVAGETVSADFPTTTGAWDATLGSAHRFDGFVVKLSADGSQLTYSTYLGGSMDDGCVGLALDSTGAAYATGFTYGKFPVTVGAFASPHLGSNAVFVTKLSTDGRSLAYSTFFGGRAVGNAIAVDVFGSAYVAGQVGGDYAFPTTGAAFQTSPNPGTANDGMVFKVSPAGDSLLYSTYLGGNDVDACYGIALDQFRNAYLTGMTRSTDFPASFRPGWDTTTNGARDAFAAKLSSDGSDVVYASYLGGSGEDYGFGIAVDSSGNAYVVGSTLSPNFPIRGDVYLFTFNGTFNGFVAKFGPSGTTLPYSTMVASAGYDDCYGLALPSVHNTIYVTGATTSQTFPSTGFGARSPSNVLVAKIRVSTSIYVP